VLGNGIGFVFKAEFDVTVVPVLNESPVLTVFFFLLSVGLTN